MTSVKICGITDKANLIAAIEAGADFIGLVFYSDSPRHINQDDARRLLNSIAPDLLKPITIVGLFVNPTDADLLVSDMLDMIQLHGDESPERCIEIKQNTDCLIMKALAIKTAQDLVQISAYEPVCDWLLFDAKPNDTQYDLPGGNGLSFDWSILEGHTMHTPWMLAGGLTPENVKTAINLLKPDAVDVSSGVEGLPGQKNTQMINAFLRAVQEA